MKRDYLTYDEAMAYYIPRVARTISRKYRRYGIEFEDVQQELHLWLLEPGREGLTGEQRCRRWLAKEPQKLYTMERAMEHAVGREGFAEKQKASAAGYKTSDVFWYTPTKVSDILELIAQGYSPGERPAAGTDDGSLWDENAAAFYADVTKAVAVVGDNEPQVIAEYLNGLYYDGPGSRRVVSNYKSQAVTSYERG